MKKKKVRRKNEVRLVGRRGLSERHQCQMLADKTLPGVSESRMKRKGKYGRGNSLLCQGERGRERERGSEENDIYSGAAALFLWVTASIILGPRSTLRKLKGQRVDMVTEPMSFYFSLGSVGIHHHVTLCSPCYRLPAGETTTPSISICVVKQPCASRDDSARVISFDVLSITLKVILPDMTLWIIVCSLRAKKKTG